MTQRYLVAIPWNYDDPEQGVYHSHAIAESEDEAQRAVAQEMADFGSHAFSDENERSAAVEYWAREWRGVDIYPARDEALNYISDLTDQDLIAELARRGYTALASD